MTVSGGDHPVKMIKLIRIMRTERDRLRRELGDEDDETVQAYDEVIELLQSFFSRTDRIYKYMKKSRNE